MKTLATLAALIFGLFLAVACLGYFRAGASVMQAVVGVAVPAALVAVLLWIRRLRAGGQ